MTGLREVLSGLKGGEDVVTSAQFMLDSESRFREAVQMMMPGQESAGKTRDAPGHAGDEAGREAAGRTGPAAHAARA